MGPVERALVERKLGQIAERLAHLERYSREGWEAYRSSFERRKAAEKLLQETIEAAIDVNSHLLVELGKSAPRDYHESFTLMSDHGFLPDELGAALAPAAGLRNRLVHQYSTIDDRRVFDAIGSAVELFPRYVTAVRRVLCRST
jgi:uncharacterized protein YutE (UPF0331/DUF86 family)